MLFYTIINSINKRQKTTNTTRLFSKDLDDNSGAAIALTLTTSSDDDIIKDSQQSYLSVSFGTGLSISKGGVLIGDVQPLSSPDQAGASKTTPTKLTPANNNDTTVPLTISPNRVVRRRYTQRKVRTHQKTVSSQKKQVVVSNLPVTHDVVSKTLLCKMRENSKQLKTIVRNLERPKYKGTEEGDQLMSAAALVMPKASQDSIQSAAPLIIAATCINAGIPVNVEKVVGS